MGKVSKCPISFFLAVSLLSGSCPRYANSMRSGISDCASRSISQLNELKWPNSIGTGSKAKVIYPLIVSTETTPVGTKHPLVRRAYSPALCGPGISEFPPVFLRHQLNIRRQSGCQGSVFRLSGDCQKSFRTPFRSEVRGGKRVTMPKRFPDIRYVRA